MKPVLLVIMDGVGFSKTGLGDAVTLANTPTLDHFLKTYPNVRVKAHGPAVGTVVEVKKPPMTYSFKALQLTENRLGAKLVPEFMENVTPPEQYEILDRMRMVGFIDRDRGTGRPTKKERRDLDAFMECNFDDDDWDF